MTEEEIAQMRTRIAELEKRDADFTRKVDLLLDKLLLTHDQIDRNSKGITHSRIFIDQLADRIGELVNSVSGLREAQQAFMEQTIVDRQIHAEIQRIWEYLAKAEKT